MIQELLHRDGLRTALSGRDDVLLEPILRLLLKHVTDTRFGDMVCDVAGIVIGRSSTHLTVLMLIVSRYVWPRTRAIPINRYIVPSAPQEGCSRASPSAGPFENDGGVRNVICFSFPDSTVMTSASVITQKVMYIVYNGYSVFSRRPKTRLDFGVSLSDRSAHCQ